MGTIADKLDYLFAAKNEIKSAIESKKQRVANSDTLFEYAEKIREIYTDALFLEEVTPSYSPFALALQGLTVASGERLVGGYLDENVFIFVTATSTYSYIYSYTYENGALVQKQRLQCSQLYFDRADKVVIEKKRNGYYVTLPTGPTGNNFIFNMSVYYSPDGLTFERKFYSSVTAFNFVVASGFSDTEYVMLYANMKPSSGKKTLHWVRSNDGTTFSDADMPYINYPPLNNTSTGIKIDCGDRAIIVRCYKSDSLYSGSCIFNAQEEIDLNPLIQVLDLPESLDLTFHKIAKYDEKFYFMCSDRDTKDNPRFIITESTSLLANMQTKYTSGVPGFSKCFMFNKKLFYADATLIKMSDTYDYLSNPYDFPTIKSLPMACKAVINGILYMVCYDESTLKFSVIATPDGWHYNLASYYALKTERGSDCTIKALLRFGLLGPTVVPCLIDAIPDSVEDPPTLGAAAVNVAMLDGQGNPVDAK